MKKYSSLIAMILFSLTAGQTTFSQQTSPSHPGFKIEKIEKGSVYEKLGLQEGDVIKKFNGKPVVNPSDAMEMYNALKTAKKVSLVIERAGKEQTLQFTAK